MDLREDSREISSDVVRLRHALHRHPEIGLHLPRTQESVLTALDGLPLDIGLGDSLTSVTGVLRGAMPGPTVLLRGDMDALAVGEQTDVDFRSEVDGVMHACGHDLHTSMLVGAAQLLAAHRDQIAGNVVFMFQPGEEGWDGAKHMVDEGVLDASGERPIAGYALHVTSSEWSQGTFVSRPGPFMAASDGLYVTVEGAGGHGSAPHKAKDPVPAACEMVTALQSFLTRGIDPFDPAVITVGSFHAGTRRNVIAESAAFEATIRSFSPEVRRRIVEGVTRLCEGVAAAHGLDVRVRCVPEYPVTVNSAEEAAFAGRAVADLFDAERFEQASRPVTGSEDFCRVLDEIPGAMVFLGAAPADVDPVGAPDNHSPRAAFDDAVLADGAALYAQLATQRLAVETDPNGGVRDA